MSYQKLAEEIIRLSGGKENFSNVYNCMTRVRISYKNNETVDKEAIRNLTGVVGTNDADTYQIIMGSGKSEGLATEIKTQINFVDSSDSASINEESQGFLKTLSNIFVPLIPAIIASGFIMGINNLLTTNATANALELGIKATEQLSATQVVLQQNGLLQISTILGLLASSTFNYLAIFVGFTSAREFKVDPILGATFGAISTLGAVSLLGLSPGQGGLFGIILGVWIMAHLNKVLKRIVPDIIDVVITPTFTIFFAGLAYLYLIMPIAGWASDLVITAIMYVLDNTGIFGGFVLSSLFPSLIATGLHHGLSGIHTELINSTGSTPIFPIQIMSNAGMLGAGIAVYLLTKRSQVKEIGRGALPATFLAVGEPTMYGLLIPNGYPFITASLGAGVGGAFIRYFDVQANAFGAAGMSAIPLIGDGAYIKYLVSYAAGAIAGFVFTYAFTKLAKKEL